MRKFLIIVALILISPALLPAQSCTQRAIRSVAKASDSIAVSDFKTATAWLNRAYDECPMSSEVARRIGKTYEAIGDERRARLYFDHAARLDAARLDPEPQPKPPSKENSFVREKWAMVVGVSRSGTTGTDAVGSKKSIDLIFQVMQVGSHDITMENTSLLDSDLVAIPAMSWFGGTATGN